MEALCTEGPRVLGPRAGQCAYENAQHQQQEYADGFSVVRGWFHMFDIPPKSDPSLSSRPCTTGHSRKKKGIAYLAIPNHITKRRPLKFFLTEDTPVPGTELDLFPRLGQTYNDTPLVHGLRADRVSVFEFKRILGGGFGCLFRHHRGKMSLPCTWGILGQG